MKQINNFYDTEDKYGNNTNFPDDILSDISKKGLLGKWTATLLSYSENALFRYYIKDRNIDAGHKDVVVSLFQDVNNTMLTLTPVLEDLVEKNIIGIEDIFIAVYGVSSDAVYVLREFKKLMKRIDNWDEDYMWNNCSNNKRLKKILLNED